MAVSQVQGLSLLPHVHGCCSSNRTSVRAAVGGRAMSMGALQKRIGGKGRVVAMAGHGASGVEPDLNEDYVTPWGIPGEEMEADGTFKYGKIDGAHSFHEGDEGTFSEQWNLALEKAGGPTGVQKWISYLFLPNFFVMVALGLEPEYYIIYTVLFLFAFIGLEMAKPEREINLEPEMYRTEK